MICRQQSSVLNFLIDLFATYRLVALVRDDKITEPIREKIYEKYGQPNEHMLAYLTTCPYCLSIYAGSAVVFGHMVMPQTTRAVTRVLALSALTGLLTEREDKLTSGF